MARPPVLPGPRPAWLKIKVPAPEVVSEVQALMRSNRLVTVCDLPVTARGVVTLVATNWGLFEPTGTGFKLREIAPGLTVDEIRATTGGTLTVEDGLREIAVTG